MSEDKISLKKRIGNRIAYGAFLIGKRKAEERLQELENEELKRAGELSLDVAEDVVYRLTDKNPDNRAQLKEYLRSEENKQKLTDLGITALRGVAIEKFNGEQLDDVLELIGLLAYSLEPEETENAPTA